MDRNDILGKPTPAAALIFANPCTFSAGADGKRQFSGVGYSGDIVDRHWFWGRVMFDMSSTKVPEVIPVLLSHDEDKIAGVTASAKVGNDGIQFTGMLYADDEPGKRVAKLADDGFPWQMSIRIHPGDVLFIDEGFSQNINGRDVAGPLYVFRDSEVSEVSFTPVGADSKTSARVFNRAASQDVQLKFSSTTKEGDSTMTPQEEQTLRDKLAAAEAMNADNVTKMAAATEAARVATFAARKGALTTEFTRLGMAVPDDKIVEGYMAMTEEQFTGVVNTFKASKPAAVNPGNAHLFRQEMNPPAQQQQNDGAENAVVKFSKKLADGLQANSKRL